jgi:hypothetical protein
MPSTLKQVLMIFENAHTPLSVPQMARVLDVDTGTLEGMIEYWIRKGKLREANSAGSVCTVCSSKTECPFVVKLPRSYELVTSDTPLPPAGQPPCTCG